MVGRLAERGNARTGEESSNREDQRPSASGREPPLNAEVEPTSVRYGRRPAVIAGKFSDETILLLGRRIHHAPQEQDAAGFVVANQEGERPRRSKCWK